MTAYVIYQAEILDPEGYEAYKASAALERRRRRWSLHRPRWPDRGARRGRTGGADRRGGVSHHGGGPPLVSQR